MIYQKCWNECVKNKMKRFNLIKTTKMSEANNPGSKCSFVLHVTFVCEFKRQRSVIRMPCECNTSWANCCKCYKRNENQETYEFFRMPTNFCECVSNVRMPTHSQKFYFFLKYKFTYSFSKHSRVASTAKIKKWDVNNKSFYGGWLEMQNKNLQKWKD